MATGFYVATSIAAREYARRGNEPDDMWGLLVWAFVAGLLSSKLLSVAADWRAFLNDPVAALVSGSGFVWFGGLLGGVIVAYLLAQRRGMSFGLVGDCAALGIPFGHAIGRLGCHVAGDGDWGTVTELPWGVAYTNAFIGWNYADGVRVHPTPIYELLAYTAIGFFLLSLRKKELATGTLLAIYLVLSSVARFLVEFVRINPEAAFGLTQAQLIAVGLAVVGGAWLLTHRSSTVAGPGDRVPSQGRKRRDRSGGTTVGRGSAKAGAK